MFLEMFWMARYDFLLEQLGKGRGNGTRKRRYVSSSALVLVVRVSMQIASPIMFDKKPKKMFKAWMFATRYTQESFPSTRSHQSPGNTARSARLAWRGERRSPSSTSNVARRSWKGDEMIYRCFPEDYMGRAKIRSYSSFLEPRVERCRSMMVKVRWIILFLVRRYGATLSPMHTMPADEAISPLCACVWESILPKVIHKRWESFKHGFIIWLRFLPALSIFEPLTSQTVSVGMPNFFHRMKQEFIGRGTMMAVLLHELAHLRFMNHGPGTSDPLRNATEPRLDVGAEAKTSCCSWELLNCNCQEVEFKSLEEALHFFFLFKIGCKFVSSSRKYFFWAKKKFGSL